MHNNFQLPKRNGWTLKSSLATLAVTVVLSGASWDAQALALGEINVYSALGQPFRAEVDVTQLSAAEANGLKAAIASRAAYQSAGVEYNPVVSKIRVSVQKRADGKTFLRLSSQDPIHEPYLGIVVDTNWASGRVVRDFTVLLDPPETKRAAVDVTPAQTALPAPATRPVAPPPLAQPAPPPAASTEPPSERDARLARAMAQAEGRAAPARRRQTSAAAAMPPPPVRPPASAPRLPLPAPAATSST
ncbi:FimV family protein [Comamonas serinivorans]|uniref:type IV pilus assembly protein FimV n=1 Tax=Comamonas serinivorans TaxID=1082851 RepID=UPI0012F8CD8F|nr:hypothetical protein [Comamonas serinivorans]